jgi:hypothetical protein
MICERTGLDEVGCAHCRPQAGPPPAPGARPTLVIQARYDGQCPACGGRIERGQWLTKCDTENAFVHDGCES